MQRRPWPAAGFRAPRRSSTALVDNEVGRLLEDLILTGGVDTSHIRWLPDDGTGAAARNGLNFTERGFGLRGAVGVSDRANNAASQLRAGDLPLEKVFGEIGVRWLHTGGIYAGLSDASAETAIAAIQAAREHQTIVSYDLNYRPSLWSSRGGKGRAQEVNREIVKHVDVLLGNEDGRPSPATGDRHDLADRAKRLGERLGGPCLVPV